MRRIQARVIPIKLRRWFPPSDPVATAVAVLCVLREDFLLELRGIIGDDFGALDANDAASRRLYFWRNSLRTLTEIQDYLNRLNGEAAFRAAMQRERPEVRETFETLKRELNRASEDFLRDLRNTLGGHIDRDVIQATLDQMDPLQEGLFDVGRKRDDIHFKFTADLVWAVLIREAAPGRETPAAETLIRKVADLSPTLMAIDHVVMSYIRDRKLLVL
jgi:hypothetical protein